MNGKGAGRKTTMRKNDDVISRQAAIDAPTVIEASDSKNGRD